MKDKNFVIKVGDLLQEGGKSDSLSFDKKLTQLVPNITTEGISGTVLLNSLNQDSLFVSIEDIHCCIEENCDRCETKYIRVVNIPKYIARFVISEERKKEEEDTSDEEIFVINARDESIDLEPMIAQAIILEEPFVKHCSICEKDSSCMGDEDEIDEGIVSGGNIIFH